MKQQSKQFPFSDFALLVFGYGKLGHCFFVLENEISNFLFLKSNYVAIIN